MNQSPGDARGAIGRTASARAREGSVPETNRETCPTARAIVCREMDGMRTVVVLRGHPAACERAPFVQSRRPRNPPGDSRGLTGRNLPRDATGPGRLVEETRGQGQVEKGSRQGNRGRRDDLGGRLRERAPWCGFAPYEAISDQSGPWTRRGSVAKIGRRPRPSPVEMAAPFLNWYAWGLGGMRGFFMCTCQCLTE